jgi:hypothetical protein
VTTPPEHVPFEGECGRCHKHVLDGEVCWYCGGCLCYDCWHIWGHCGHPEAEEINEQGRTMGLRVDRFVTQVPDTPEVRAALGVQP